MPHNLSHFAMIPSPNGKGVIVIGGESKTFEKDDDDDEVSDLLMELNGDTLQWKILDQKLDAKRRYHNAIPISYEFDLDILSQFCKEDKKQDE